MAEHHAEEEQIEALKRWWKENQNFVLVGLVIGSGAVLGWRLWQNWQARHAEEASAMYAKLEKSVTAKDDVTAGALGDALRKDYANTPYAADAALLQAKAHVDAGALAKAHADLEWTVANSHDAELTLLARVRLARVEIAEGHADLALKTLDGADIGAFVALAQDTRGDAMVALGRSADARKAYQAAVAAAGDNLVDREMLQLKLEDLGPAPIPASASAPAVKP